MYEAKKTSEEVSARSLEAANSWELEHAASTTLISKHGEGEAVDQRDLWECLFGAALGELRKVIVSPLVVDNKLQGGQASNMRQLASLGYGPTDTPVFEREQNSLGVIHLDWSRLGNIGQAILIREFTAEYGSVQKLFDAFQIQFNEADSFVSTYIQDKEKSDRGKLVAKQWGRGQAVSLDVDDDEKSP
ncbi:hypothetical protein F5Y19DRAFT_489728 [Xylariaceae sp. FL1651]|nr:hypothetical protein F5Y19DRAFT_489728 [Xylariaceae sp. FL1651]